MEEIKVKDIVKFTPDAFDEGVPGKHINEYGIVREVMEYRNTINYGVSFECEAHGLIWWAHNSESRTAVKLKFSF